MISDIFSNKLSTLFSSDGLSPIEQFQLTAELTVAVQHQESRAGREALGRARVILEDSEVDEYSVRLMMMELFMAAGGRVEGSSL